MMRLALFEIGSAACALPLEKVLHILTAPRVFELPLLRSCFVGLILFRGEPVPLLADSQDEDSEKQGVAPEFVLVCEAEFGLVGVPADRIVKLTDTGDVALTQGDDISLNNKFEMFGRNYHSLDLNQIMEHPGYTICGMMD